MTDTLPQPYSHKTDLPLGGYVFHGLKTVKIFGRERNQETGIIEIYTVVANEGTKNEKRYQVAANELSK